MMKHREYHVWVDNNPAVDSGEQITQADPSSWPPVEGLKSLRQFCKTGVGFEELSQDADLLAKELLYYCVLDVFAQVQKKGSKQNFIQKSDIPSLPYLVHAPSFCIATGWDNF